MSYEQLAYVYDRLMTVAPYGDWVKFLLEEKDKFHAPGIQVLDLGCGTGELSIRMIREGFNVTGVDVSEDMLAVAREKASSEGVDLPLYHQDMSELESLGMYDIIVIFCDSLNYLASPEQVKSTFARAFRHLAPDGLFIFDVHSIYQIEKGFLNETFTWNEEEVAYIWTSFPGEHRFSVEHEITFFVRDSQTGQYDRIDELHKQRTYPLEDYIKWLNDAGFETVHLTADFSESPPQETSRRIFFTCKKS